jgi:prophage antirepressor-like protein
MNSIIDIFNNILIYNSNKIDYVIDNENNIWFKFTNISNLLKYKSSKDALRDLIDKENKKLLKNIKLLIKSKDHPNTVYINEKGIYSFLIKSRMKNAKEFQFWLINEVLPNLRKHGKYQLNKKIKLKLKNLNKKIKILEKNNKVLHNNMTKNKYPQGTHIYIIEDDKKYKIGYTDDLKKRLQTYNTGKANKLEYVYYKKTKCGKEIEICLKAMLNKYIYKSNKEFYVCDVNIIIKKILNCIKIEKSCINCKSIKHNEQSGGNTIFHKIENLRSNNYIIENIIDIYKYKYKYYNNIINKI